LPFDVLGPAEVYRQLAAFVPNTGTGVVAEEELDEFLVIGFYSDVEGSFAELIRVYGFSGQVWVGFVLE